MSTAYRYLKALVCAGAICGGSLLFAPTALLHTNPSARTAPALVAEQNAEQARADFFEARIRPLLIRSCYGCHTQAQSGGLRLDAREGLLAGGARGPAIVPGQPAESLLIKAVSHTHERLKMPQKAAKLTNDEIAALTQWIKDGAVWPNSPVTASKGGYEITPEQRAFWSFQLPQAAPLPAVKQRDWPQNPIDNFILAELEKKNLQPSPGADKRTLLRRATYDLTGLPPTEKEIADFAADHTPAAFAKVVDRLLASPRYGERWGRHWLDVARYADTRGGDPFPYSYTYRDWVIRAFNEDLPYDQFLIQQIAADRVPGNDAKNLAALGFLTLGRGGDIEDQIDDRIDVVTRGTMGLTVSCARCHNHKFDPIPTKDYYSLYSVFANTRAPKELPLLSGAKSADPRAAYFETEIKKIEDRIAKDRETRHPILKAGLRAPAEVAKYLLATHAARDLTRNTALDKLTRERDISLFMLRRWQSFLHKAAAQNDAVFAAWRAFAALPEKDFAAQAATVSAQIANHDGSKINPLVAKIFATPPASLREAAERYASLLATYDKPDKLADPHAEALRQVFYAADAPANVAFKDFDQIRIQRDINTTNNEQQKIAKLRVAYAYNGAPPRAMAVEDVPQPKPGRVFVRGNPADPGDEVARQFLLILAGDKRQPFKQGSGRLELAQAIACKDNPLTSRVLVNRVWLHLFGAGLVRTPSDFGTRGDAPTHPELLDYLALKFMDDGWSVKRLIRQIVLARTYQQSSADNQAARRVDPENALLWRMNRRRLDFESLRDSLLAVSGRLDATVGGLPVSANTWPFAGRRTVYSFISRGGLPGVFRAFDFASPDEHNAQRYLTTVPQQALFLMNSPFVLEQARQLAARPEIANEPDATARIQNLYRVVYGRAASADEIKLGLQFIASKREPVRSTAFRRKGLGGQGIPAEAGTTNAWQYGKGEYDAPAQRVKTFEPFRYFSGGGWQVGQLRPDPQIGNAHLSDKGGYPGNGAANAVIRRWVAPFDGQVIISGTLDHDYDITCGLCDGVQAWIASSRAGQLGTWIVHRSSTETNVKIVEVKQGDTIDFIVSSYKVYDRDPFNWTVVIRKIEPPTTLTGKRAGQYGKYQQTEWHSVADFRGPAVPRLNAWERYAQALLAAVEFMFVD